MKKVFKILIPCMIFGLLTGFGIFALNASKNTETKVDQSCLYIGIPKSQDNKPVSLHVSVDSNSGVAYKEYSSEDLVTLPGQDEDIVFLEYTADPLVPLNNKDIGYWLAEAGNSIKVQTECLELIMSDYVKIDKAGIWFVNVAVKDGETPDFSHSNIYKKGGIL